ncbi:hypothetical protein niasHT_029929 [Heterodera trifolii]|uniref:Uncharacterized protein n=1 Tax=Heterodera trifolii TaxID=157864 RepID=A0ABD2KFV0_9BILA
MQLERDQRAAGISSKPKRLRMADVEMVADSLPPIYAYDFEILRNIFNSDPAPNVEAENENPLNENDQDAEEISDGSIKFDIWKPPKSPGSVSLPSAISGTSQSTQTSRIQLQLATYKVLGRTQIDCDIFNCLSGDMAKQILLIKGNLGHLYLAPSTEPDEDDEQLLNFDELEIIED